MEDVLDDELARRIPVIIHHSFGSILPKTGVYFSYVMLACGLLLLVPEVMAMVSYRVFVVTGALILGTLLTVISALAATMRTGVYLDTANRRMRQYSSYLGVKSGKWNGMEMYPFLTLFKSKLSSTIYSRGNVALDLTDTVYDVFLLSKNHRQRVLIYTCPGKDQALQMARILGKKLEKEVVIYNPQTTSRKRRT
jgi:hypothetical protein